MSVFALGGNAGFALGSLITAPVLLLAGLRGTVLLIVPALVMVVILVTRLTTILDRPGQRRTAVLPTGVDDWPAFLRLTSVVVVRAVLFFGLTSFLALYFIHELGASPGVGDTEFEDEVQGQERREPEEQHRAHHDDRRQSQEGRPVVDTGRQHCGAALSGTVQNLSLIHIS